MISRLNAEVAAAFAASFAVTVAAFHCCEWRALARRFRREWVITVLEEIDRVEVWDKKVKIHPTASSLRKQREAKAAGEQGAGAGRPSALGDESLQSPRATSSTDPGLMQTSPSCSGRLAGSPAKALRKLRPQGLSRLVSPANAALGLGVEHRAREMASSIWQEEWDLQDRNWTPKGGHDPLAILTDKGQPHDQGKFLIRLAEAVLPVVAAEATVLSLEAPAKIFGDIHGQLRDLLLMLHNYGYPGVDGPTFVFNGDFVDRGRHQPEVVALLFAFKLAYPRDVFLIRGNHEDAALNDHMGHCGFSAVCFRRFGSMLGKRVFEAVSRVFDHLPLAAVLETRILVLHGGLGNGEWSLRELEEVKRPLSPADLQANPMVYNVLWSDPAYRGDQDRSIGVHKSVRDGGEGNILTFGKSVTRDFCIRHGLSMVVRSHQVHMWGNGFDVQHGGRLVRVFTARDYEGAQNDGAILSIEKDERYRNGLAVRPQQLLSLKKRSADKEF